MSEFQEELNQPKSIPTDSDRKLRTVVQIALVIAASIVAIWGDSEVSWIAGGVLVILAAGIMGYRQINISRTNIDVGQEKTSSEQK